VRSTKIGGLKVKKGQAIGFLDRELVSAGNARTEVLKEVLSSVGFGGSELITIYYGADTERDEAEGVAEEVRQGHPELQVEVIGGGQPSYNYIVSVE